MTEQVMPYAAQVEQGFNNESFIKIRLDTDQLLRRLELFLSSSRVTLVQDEKGNLSEQVVGMGDALCNKQGLNGILQIVELMVNPQTVQGNFVDLQAYSDYIFFARREIADEIVTNRIRWGIKEENAKMIIDSIMRLLKPFFSRLIKNLERESYKGGFTSREVVMHSDKKGLASFANGLGGK